MLIAFEGIDGSGKTTLMAEVSRLLRDRKHVVFTTREPGGTPLAEMLRSLLSSHTNMSPLTQMFLFCAARTDLVARKIKPLMQEHPDVIVLTDRYAASTIAYSLYGHQLLDASVVKAARASANGLIPDLNIWVDTPVDIAEQRRKQRAWDNGHTAPSEPYDRAFYERVRTAYQDFSLGTPGNPQMGDWVTLDGTLSLAILAEDAVKVILGTKELI